MGLVLSFLSQGFPPKSRFSVDDIPDLSGKVVIVTGANTGVGKETAKALLARNAKVYVAARNEAKARVAIQDLKDTTGKQGIFLQLDLADLQSVKTAAEEFLSNSKENQLHILFNNAGVMLPPVPLVTAQDYDLQFGTNVLGHFYFTKLLLPALISTAKSSGDKTRIINTSSFASTLGKIDFNTFKDGPARKRMFSQDLYNQSKLGNVIFSNEVARRYSDDGIVSVAVNPGNLRTDLQRHMTPVSDYLIGYVLWPAPMGALTQLWAGTSEEGRDLNGKYCIPWARIGDPNPLAQDQKLGGDLWKWLEEQVQDL